DRSVVTREAEAKAAMKEAEEAKLEELRQQQLTPEQKWMQSLKTDPTNVPPYLYLAESSKKRGQIDEAAKILKQGLKAVPTDHALLGAFAEIRMILLDKAIAHYAAKHRERPHDPEFKNKLDQALKLRSDEEIKELRRKVELQPEDKTLRLELGIALQKA